MEKTMEKIVALAKARGFVYPGSEIYGIRWAHIASFPIAVCMC